MGFFISKCPTFTAIMHSALESLIKGSSISFNGTKGCDLGNNPKKFPWEAKKKKTSMRLPEVWSTVKKLQIEGLKKTA